MCLVLRAIGSDRAGAARHQYHRALQSTADTIASCGDGKPRAIGMTKRRLADLTYCWVGRYRSYSKRMPEMATSGGRL